jgi:beta-galactosidase/beta-glucuronidase
MVFGQDLKCEITDFVIPGQEALLTVGVVDEKVENSTSTFNHGGIIRSVKLMAAPQNHITRFNVK